MSIGLVVAMMHHDMEHGRGGDRRHTHLRFWKQVRTRPFSFAIWITLSASAVDRAKGLSTMTIYSFMLVARSAVQSSGRAQSPCFPANSAFSANSAWVSMCVATTTSAVSGSAKNSSGVR